ncbi:Gustatory receptor [Camponotus japonicus]
MLQVSKMFQPKTMHEMIMPLLVANFALGIGIWTNKRGRILNFAYSFICLVSYCVLMRYSIEYIYTNYYTQKSNQFGIMTFRAMFYANICSTLFLVPSGWLRKRYMKMAIMRIMMCEKTMEQMGIQKNYRKLYLNQLYALVFIVLTFIIFIIISYDGMFVKDTPMHVKIVLILAINYPIALLYVSDVSFLQWVRYAKLRFEQLNNLLQRMLTTTPDSPQHKRVLKMKDEWNKTSTSVTQQDRRSEENTNTMRAVKQVHLELIKATRCTNEAYGIQILCSMTISFVFITSLLYYAYSIFWVPLSREVFRQEMIPVIGWILFYASKVLIINHMCALASAEAANTGDIICELYEPSTSKEFRAEIRDFTLQLIQNPLIFTACGFFNLDHTFIHGVIGSVTTYLVILIQVGDLPQSNTTKNSSIIYNNETSLTTLNTLTTYV